MNQRIEAKSTIGTFSDHTFYYVRCPNCEGGGTATQGTESQWPILKWFLCHRCGDWGTSEKEWIFLLNLANDCRLSSLNLQIFSLTQNNFKLESFRCNTWVLPLVPFHVPCNVRCQIGNSVAFYMGEWFIILHSAGKRTWLFSGSHSSMWQTRIPIKHQIVQKSWWNDPSEVCENAMEFALWQVGSLRKKMVIFRPGVDLGPRVGSHVMHLKLCWVCEQVQDWSLPLPPTPSSLCVDFDMFLCWHAASDPGFRREGGRPDQLWGWWLKLTFVWTH